jgi:hypothetical protein
LFPAQLYTCEILAAGIISEAGGTEQPNTLKRAKYKHAVETGRSSHPRAKPDYEGHQKEVFWQITIPLAVGIILILAIAIFFRHLWPPPGKSQMADIALIQLMIPAPS